MVEQSARLVALFCMGLAAGITVCVLLTERNWAGTAQFYTELKQLWIHVLTVPGPLLGAVGLLAMVIEAWLLFTRGAKAAFWVIAAAIMLNLVALVLTKAGHFPINDEILKWSAANPPADWSLVRARWLALHTGRTVCAVGSFVLLLLSDAVRV